MSNRKRQIHSMLNSPDFLKSERVPFASVEVIRDDQILNVLLETLGSRRSFALRCAQSLADAHKKAFVVYEGESHAFRTLAATDEPPGLGWALIARQEPAA